MLLRDAVVDMVAQSNREQEAALVAAPLLPPPQQQGNAEGAGKDEGGADLASSSSSSLPSFSTKSEPGWEAVDLVDAMLSLVSAMITTSQVREVWEASATHLEVQQGRLRF